MRVKEGERVKIKRNTERITNEVLCGEYNAVYRYVISLCHDENLASDITQETFLKAMSTTKGFEGQSSLYTWLCAIAKRIFLNKCKKQGREVFEESYFEKSPPKKVCRKKKQYSIFTRFSTKSKNPIKRFLP